MLLNYFLYLSTLKHKINIEQIRSLGQHHFRLTILSNGYHSIFRISKQCHLLEKINKFKVNYKFGMAQELFCITSLTPIQQRALHFKNESFFLQESFNILPIHHLKWLLPWNTCFKVKKYNSFSQYVSLGSIRCK